MEQKYPSIEVAEKMLLEAEQMNPGQWVSHSRYAALAARNIAQCCDDMCAEKAYVLGLLHDIGYKYGATYMKHILHGYNYCISNGYDDVAKICLTHSFPSKNINAAFGSGCWEYCTNQEYNFIAKFIDEVDFDDYDFLIQLCDALALPTGFSLIEKRMIDVALRHGITKPDFIIEKWKKTFDIKTLFENRIDKSIYDVLPGVIENTFN
jgi:hypothetical protein